MCFNDCHFFRLGVIFPGDQLISVNSIPVSSLHLSEVNELLNRINTEFSVEIEYLTSQIGKSSQTFSTCLVSNVCKISFLDVQSKKWKSENLTDDVTKSFISCCPCIILVTPTLRPPLKTAKHACVEMYIIFEPVTVLCNDAILSFALCVIYCLKCLMRSEVRFSLWVCAEYQSSFIWF